MAWYPAAVRKELPQNRTQPRISPRTIALHTAVSNGGSLFNFFNGRSRGVESHFYVRADGTVEQYMDTAVRADCQVDANPFAVSIETWDGYGAVWTNERDLPAWTTAQVHAIARLMAWLHRTHGIPLRVSQYWNDSGVGWHRKYIGNPGWARSARACPGDRRVAQVPGLITAARQLVTPPPPPTDPPPEEDDPMAGLQRHTTHSDRVTELVRGEWRRVLVRDEGPSFSVLLDAGHARHWWGTVSLRIEGLPAGDSSASQVQARFVQFAADDPTNVTYRYPIEERATTQAGDFFALTEAGGFLPAGQRLRVDVAVFAPDGARITSARCRIHTVPA